MSDFLHQRYYELMNERYYPLCLIGFILGALCLVLAGVSYLYPPLPRRRQ